MPACCSGPGGAASAAAVWRSGFFAAMGGSLFFLLLVAAPGAFGPWRAWAGRPDGRPDRLEVDRVDLVFVAKVNPLKTVRITRPDGEEDLGLHRIAQRGRRSVEDEGHADHPHPDGAPVGIAPPVPEGVLEGLELYVELHESPPSAAAPTGPGLSSRLDPSSRGACA